MIRLRVIQGQSKGQILDTGDPEITIGRSPQAALTLEDGHLSHEHGLIFREGEQLFYRDLQSTNGSMVRRGTQRIVLDGSERSEVALSDGDELLLGDAATPVILQCQISEEGDSEPHRVLATVPFAEISHVENKLESGPAVSALYNAVKLFGGRIELSEVLAAVAEGTLALISRATHVAVLLSEGEEADRFVPVLARGRDRGQTEPGSVMMSRAVLKRVLKERSGVLAANAPAELGGSASIMGANIRSTIGVPLWRGEKILGVIQCDNRASTGIFSEHDLQLLLVLGRQAALAIDNAQLHQQLKLAQKKTHDENIYLRQRQPAASFDSIVGESKAMQDVFAQLEKVIDTRATVCINGETGTGKELIAQAIHFQSKRRDKMFVAQNCAALPATLLESELFGHQKGAFTGADKEKKGLFEIADGGTLFLDEIAEMELVLQAKLLRVLQEGEIRPVGATKAKRVDVRIITATNRNLDDEVREERFRQDLFYRLMVFPITVPPLRERREDIVELAHHFLKQYASEMRRSIGSISQETINHFQSYDWPGNVRELENEIQRLVIQIDDGSIIQPEHLSPRLRRMENVVERIAPKKGTLKEKVESVERFFLTEALRDHGGNKTRAAVTLGITREGLHKKLAKHGI